MYFDFIFSLTFAQQHNHQPSKERNSEVVKRNTKFQRLNMRANLEKWLFKMVANETYQYVFI